MDVVLVVLYCTVVQSSSFVLVPRCDVDVESLAGSNRYFTPATVARGEVSRQETLINAKARR